NQLLQAEAEFRAAIDEFRHLGPVEALDPDSCWMVAGFHQNLGTVLARQKRYPAAQREFDTVRDLFGQLTARYPHVPLYRYAWAKSHVDRGVLLKTADQIAPAETAFKDAVEQLVTLTRQFPRNVEYAQVLGLAAFHLGEVAAFQGKVETAEAALK